MKTALVLGGTYPHIALIQKLKERGYYTILVDYLDHPSAQPYADEHIQESTLDKEKVFELARERNAELVISTCIDQANVTCCYVAEKLGLSKPYTYEVSLNVTDKVRMKQIMIANQISTSRHYTISSFDEYDTDRLRFPIIVKPADSNSSKGVRRIEKDDLDAEKYIKEALSLSRNGAAIIEEYIVGREIGADCMIVNHRAHVVMTRERRKIDKNNTDAIQQIYGSFWPAALTERNVEQLRLIAEEIALAFNLDNTPLMMQTILANDEFDVIEFGARVGGGDNYQIIEELTGYDIIQNAIRSFLGEPIEVSDLGRRTKLLMDNYLYVNPPKDNGSEEQLFGSVSYNDIARQNIEYEKVYRRKGDAIGCKISSNNRVGCFVVSGTTEQELMEKQALVVANMEVYDVDGKPIMRKDIYYNQKMDKPIAIVLGGTMPHVHLIELLKQRNYYTILLDYTPNPPAKEYADEHLLTSTLDKEAVLEVARSRKASLVISTCIDQANSVCCYVAEKLNLPHPYSYEISLYVTNKGLMKTRMKEFNIPSSPFILTKDMDSVNWNLVSFPCVVKPVDCNSSKGVHRAESIEEARHYVEEAIHLSQTGEAIIEEFCSGDEIQVDCVALETPFSEEAISQLTVGDVVGISGYIYCGRDAVLPRICNELEDGTWSRRGIDLKGGVIFHTAVSPAGVGPTSSNKLEIEGSFEVLSSKGGIKMHLGKGAIKSETVKMLAENNAVFAIIPPVTALLERQTLERECVAWPELGMEALYRIKVKNYQAIIAAAKGESIY